MSIWFDRKTKRGRPASFFRSIQISAAALPNVAVVAYDWKTFTFQELVRYVKRVLGPSKVTSVAVVSPGSAAGTVGKSIHTLLHT